MADAVATATDAPDATTETLESLMTDLVKSHSVKMQEFADQGLATAKQLMGRQLNDLETNSNVMHAIVNQQLQALGIAPPPQ